MKNKIRILEIDKAKILLIIFFILSGDLVLSQTYKTLISDTNYINTEYNSGVTLYSFKDSLKDGLWLLYFDGVKIAQCPYKKGKMHGKYIEFYKDSTISSITKYKKGQKSGRHYKYDKDGNLKVKCFYKKNIFHGFYTWYSKGELVSKSIYVNGNRVKNKRFKNDVLIAKLRYRNGELVLKKEYYENGEIKKRTIYPRYRFYYKQVKDYSEKGKLIGKKYFDKDGNLIK